MNPWFTIKAAAKAEEPVEILIYDQIGKDWWTGDGVAAKEFAEQLQTIPKDKEIRLRINSPGGSVWDGLSIYNLLKARGEKVTAVVDGMAASIASIIALAGKTLTMPKSALLMIHRAWGMAVGNKTDMARMSADLEKHDEILSQIYAAKTGKSREAILEKMDAETIFSGEEAQAFGLADCVTDLAPVMAMQFDLTKLPKLQERVASILATHARSGSAAQPTPPPKDTIMETTTAPVTTPAPAPAEPQTKASATDPALISLLEKMNAKLDDLTPKPPPGVEPVRNGPTKVTSQGLQDHLRDQGLKTHAERYAYMRNNWENLAQHYPLLPPQGANTDTASGALTVGLLADGVVTVLQNRLAPLRAFTRNFTSNRIGRNVIFVPKAVAGGTAQSNPTSFEDATNFVGEMDDCPITPAHIVSGAHITNAELQNGWRMAWWIDLKVGEFSDKLQSLVNAIITTTNFDRTTSLGTAALTAAAASFGASELRSLWGSIKKARTKSILLDGEYYAQFLPTNLESFNPLAGNTYPGWDGFYLNTYWTGATTNTTCFACNPQAVLIGAGLPLTPANMPGSANLSITPYTLPDLGLTVDICTWFATAARVQWWTIECMFGAAIGDTTAGVMVKSA